MKGIILAGGKGTRLSPLTLVNNKHLLPVYNKPMIMFPLETLKSFGIKDVLIVSGGNHIGSFADVLGDGSQHGVNLTYKIQKEAGGIAQALGIAKDFAHGEGIMVILGDNIFGDIKLEINETKACFFLKDVPNPKRFGVAQFDQNNNLINIQEKPSSPPSNYAVTGLYYYPNEVFDIISILKPSARGELEITDVNNYFIDKGCLQKKINCFWSDAGTFESLLHSSNYIKNKEKIDE